MPKPADPVPARIFTIRSHRVILDSDLARLYGVPTKVFNQAFKRNAHRFPEDFAFQLTNEEVSHLRAQMLFRVFLFMRCFVNWRENESGQA